MDNMRCTQCDATGLETGFVEESGQGARGYARWIAGPLQIGLLGGAKKAGKPTRRIEAYRCPACSHLELFATDRVD
ncbi:hypothetical protein [Streptomyces sp. ITFR-6]|uniref:hypothetical protein n=1 Tax=Streptomyces sp. ITFR-6 TaxID=3075197 RepID=UPI002889A46C|nr:hypothetical protein [Streptomyces sp. ITFR-6]WNI31517.1 hypothetical protein RLT59_24020 [Streptomyces sp. ITFR-6]